MHSSSILSVAALALLPFAVAAPAPSWSNDYNKPKVDPVPQRATANVKPFVHTNKAILDSLPLTTENGTLPAPDGMALRYITMGRGVQNYTCASSTSADAPKAIGALAVLYDITAITLLTPSIAAQISNIAVDMTASSFILRGRPLDIPDVGSFPVIGDHFFLADGTPTFDLFDVGKRAFCKVPPKSINAPLSSVKGPAGFGTVKWLALATKEESVGIATVYRVDTAGGNPPKTCENQPSVISIPYAAAYHFYGFI
ncbi:hypothetical protein B0O99DRAFT_555123 [Bisporella sp. PMI_857]|nr:hypothetical protein B0O99DRAFT_555123 [Bisporella sp. PMI_857]